MDNEQSELDTIWEEAGAFTDQGDYDKAIETYKYILVRYGDDLTAVEYANAGLAEIYLTLVQFSQAEKHIKKAIQHDPKKPDYHYVLGSLYCLQEEWKKAIGSFQSALAIKPDDPEYLRGLGWATARNGDNAKGLMYLRQATKLAPTNARILMDLAALHLNIADFANARKYCHQALKANPNNALAKELLDSIEHFSEIAKDEPKG